MVLVNVVLYIYLFIDQLYVHRRKGMVELDEKEWPYKYIYSEVAVKILKSEGKLSLRKHEWMNEWHGFYINICRLRQALPRDGRNVPLWSKTKANIYGNSSTIHCLVREAAHYHSLLIFASIMASSPPFLSSWFNIDFQN